jgi:hypothetical protein
MFSMILGLFSLDFVSLQMVYRRQADDTAARLVLQSQRIAAPTAAREQTTDLCLLGPFIVSMAENRARSLGSWASAWPCPKAEAATLL